MSGSPAVEIDFFRLNDESSSHKKLSDHRTTRDIQGVISKINPELLKTAIASASAKKKKTPTFKSSSSSTTSYPHHLQTLPVYNKDCGGGGSSSSSSKSVAPLTIFYNGSVSVFDVSADQADKIMKLAENNVAKNGGEVMIKGAGVSNQHHRNNEEELLGGVLGRSDLPMSRKKSLRRFLEKRKERQVTINPYACSQGSEC